MKKISIFILFLLLNMLFITSCNNTQSVTKDLPTVAHHAYDYAYPMVLNEISRKVITYTQSMQYDVPVAGHQVGTKFPMNQIHPARIYPTPSFNDVVSPNVDTLYLAAFIDLAKEPMILVIPNMGNHYFLLQMMGAWTDVFASPGTRTGYTSESKVVLVGPNFKGTLPEDLKRIDSPTSVLIMGGRIQARTEQDIKEVHALQDQFKLIPLSSYLVKGTDYNYPTSIPLEKGVDPKTAPFKQVAKMNAKEYFTLFASLLKNNPPVKEDAEMVKELAQIGIFPGKDFNFDSLSQNIKDALNNTMVSSNTQLVKDAQSAAHLQNGWNINLKIGKYGTDYHMRAIVNLTAYGANRPEDAVYPFTYVDSENKPLNGSNKYILHFNKNEIPPVNEKAFWSLTLYNENHRLVSNTINRYAINSRDSIKYNADGSLDIYIQAQNPGKDKESNWLPSTQKGEGFNLFLRLYWPKESVLNGKWIPPFVKRVG